MHQGIYPQSIQGKFRNIKNQVLSFLLLIYFLTPLIRWDRGEGNPSQAIMIDLAGRRGYFFGIEIWPSEVYYITGILILAALGLFICTSLFGRVWCGFSCPHTVFTDIFFKIEKLFQGDRNTRIKRDAAGMDYDKFTRKAATHIAWIFVGFSFGIGWVAYFYDVFLLWGDLFNFSVTKAAMNWILGLTFSTYFFAGFVREKVCIYMCPYGRFQSAMVDDNSLVVTYNTQRGEPRGKPSSDEARGACIDCLKCVLVCPMGIDIRDGLQMECISCGLCIDACNTVMPKVGKPSDYLISFDSVNNEKNRQDGKESKVSVLQMKILMYSCVFCIVAGLMLYSLLHKSEYKIYITQGRGAFVTTLPDGGLRTTYHLKIYNKSNEVKKFKISLVNKEKAQFFLQRYMNGYSDSMVVALEPDDSINTKLFVKYAEARDIILAIKDLRLDKIVYRNLDYTQLN